MKQRQALSIFITLQDSKLMKYKWLEEKFTYDGSQLRSLFGYSHGLSGDCLISWRGPCDVHRKFMVDMEDFHQKAKIQSQDMLHFIIEMFDKPLILAIGYQRLFVQLIKDIICQFLSDQSKSHPTPSHLINFYEKLQRKGDDLYFKDKKINISIATVSPISSLLHIGINISHEGTPVPTMGLQDFHIDPLEFSKKIMRNWIDEYTSMIEATCKVKWVP